MPSFPKNTFGGHGQVGPLLAILAATLACGSACSTGGSDDADAGASTGGATGATGGSSGATGGSPGATGGITGKGGATGTGGDGSTAGVTGSSGGVSGTGGGTGGGATGGASGGGGKAGGTGGSAGAAGKSGGGTAGTTGTGGSAGGHPGPGGAAGGTTATGGASGTGGTSGSFGSVPAGYPTPTTANRAVCQSVALTTSANGDLVCPGGGVGPSCIECLFGGSTYTTTDVATSQGISEAGNYAVTVTLGGTSAGQTEIHAEANRVLLGLTSTSAGQSTTYSFAVNVRAKEGQPTENVAAGYRGSISSSRDRPRALWRSRRSATRWSARRPNPS